MELLKTLVMKYFEALIILVVVTILIVLNFVIDQKLVFLNIFYLPVLFCGYSLGKKQAILVSIFVVAFVIFMSLFYQEKYLEPSSPALLYVNIGLWGGFLFLAAYTVGTLYERYQLKIAEIKQAYIGIIEILSKYLEAADRYTKGHSVRVADYATEIAIAMQLSRPEVENIRVAGLLHDIGKVEISGEILNKAAKLSQEEKKIVDQHADRGAKLLSTVGSVLKEAVPIVLAHHIHFCEGGDPRHAVIPLGARILAVADSFDAMVSDRPYRKGRTTWEAVEELARFAGTQFDPDVVDAFKRVLKSKDERS